MNKILPFLILTTIYIQAFECQVEIDNEQVAVSRVFIDGNEEIGLHRDDYNEVVIAIKGGTITRIEANGREVDVVFPTGIAVYRPKDPEGELHRSINKSAEAMELIAIQIKNTNQE